MNDCACNDLCVCARTNPLVVNGEVVVELDDAFGLLLELSVGLLRPPLPQVAVPVVLPPCGHEASHH